MSANWTAISMLERIGPEEWIMFDRSRRVGHIERGTWSGRQGYRGWDNRKM